jgi:hypothetical protein
LISLGSLTSLQSFIVLVLALVVLDVLALTVLAGVAVSVSVMPALVMVVEVVVETLLALLSVTRLGKINLPTRFPKKDDNSLKNGGFGAGEMVWSGNGVWILVSTHESCSVAAEGESLMTDLLFGRRREEKLLRRVGVSSIVEGVGAMEVRW